MVTKQEQYNVLQTCKYKSHSSCIDVFSNIYTLDGICYYKYKCMYLLL